MGKGKRERLVVPQEFDHPLRLVVASPGRGYEITIIIEDYGPNRLTRQR
jgi:hypothetical protein